VADDVDLFVLLQQLGYVRRVRRVAVRMLVRRATVTTKIGRDPAAIQV